MSGDSPPSKGPPSPDVALLHSPTEDGKGIRILRARGEGIELGEVRPLEEGKPVHGEIVTLKPREGSADPRVCDVEVHYSARRPAGRPAQVASDRYRENWAQIFDRTVGEDERPDEDDGAPPRSRPLLH